MKNIIIGIVVLAVIGAGVYYFTKSSNVIVVDDQTIATSTDDIVNLGENKAENVIGKSVEGRDIVAYNFGTGEKQILFVGGIHGGYEWNTALVAYKLISYLKAQEKINK